MPFPLNVAPIRKNLGNSASFLSIGAGAGGDVFQALQLQFTEIHAVEVNPYINRLMTDGMLKDYSGRIYLDPRVKVVTEDARSYVRRFDNRFDVIYSLSSNTFAALASGAFALAENYLFTVEAFQDYYRALSPRGFLVMEHQRYVPRLVGEAMEALRAQGVDHPERHLAVFALPNMHRQVLVLSKQPMDVAFLREANAHYDPDEIQQLFPEQDPKADPLISSIINHGWQQAAPKASIDLSPCHDTRPFTSQLGLWRHFKFKRITDPSAIDFNGFPASKVMILILLAIIAIIVLPLNWIPARQKNAGLGWRGWGYFFAIGLGFMMLEVVLIQQYTLLIGPSAYTVAVILVTLLVGSGLGSRWTPNVKTWVPFMAILLWILVDILAFLPFTRALAGLPMWARSAAAAAAIAPLAFFMGMPFPMGTFRAKTFIDWGFAVNGAASVLGSACVMLVSFHWGFPVAMGLSGLAYLAALGLLSSCKTQDAFS